MTLSVRRVSSIGAVFALGVVLWFGACVKVISDFKAFDLRLTPTVESPFVFPEELPAKWRRVYSHGVSVAVPRYLKRRKKASTFPGTFMLANRPETIWLSIRLDPHRSLLAPYWIRSALFAKWNPLGLMAKGLMVPRLGTRTPKFVAQRLGPWQAYLYLGPERTVADLVGGGKRLRVALMARKEGLIDLELAKKIFASIRVEER